MRANLLFYDIPQSLKVANPSAALRRCAVRVNLSCWVVPEERTPWDLIEELKSQNVDVQLIRFDENEAEKLRGMAREAMQRELARIKNGLEKSIDFAQHQLANAEFQVAEQNAAFDMEVEQTRYVRRVKTILNRAKKDLLAAQECSLAFELTAQLEELIDGTRHALRAAQNAFLEEVKEQSHAAV
jgi:hypothetical protein